MWVKREMPLEWPHWRRLFKQVDCENPSVLLHSNNQNLETHNCNKLHSIYSELYLTRDKIPKWDRNVNRSRTERFNNVSIFSQTTFKSNAITIRLLKVFVSLYILKMFPLCGNRNRCWWLVQKIRRVHWWGIMVTMVRLAGVSHTVSESPWKPPWWNSPVVGPVDTKRGGRE